jgi:hypothetical protein
MDTPTSLTIQRWRAPHTISSGTTLVGNSIEWIVERPGVGGGLATLTNYIDVPWPYGIAWNYTASRPTYFYEGENPPAPNTLYVITMLDNNGAGISSPTLENTTSCGSRIMDQLVAALERHPAESQAKSTNGTEPPAYGRRFFLMRHPTHGRPALLIST